MNRQQFISSLAESSPPDCSPLIESLWWDKKDQWEQAHDLAQEVKSSEGAWVHAYLHRKEGDLWNADYWYARANKSRPDMSLEEEWESLVDHFLD